MRNDNGLGLGWAGWAGWLTVWTYRLPHIIPAQNRLRMQKWAVCYCGPLPSWHRHNGCDCVVRHRPDQARPDSTRPDHTVPIHLSVHSTSKLTILMLNDDYINVHEIWKWWNGVANMYIYCQRQSSTLKTRWVIKIKLTDIHQGLEWMQQRLVYPVSSVYLPKQPKMDRADEF